MQSYSAVADVTAETNGLKEAVKGSDGTFTFKARTNGTGSGLKDQALQTASNVTATVKEANGSYGEFLRVDITGDGYGALGAKMYAVKWDTTEMVIKFWHLTEQNLQQITGCTRQWESSLV